MSPLFIGKQIALAKPAPPYTRWESVVFFLIAAVALVLFAYFMLFHRGASSSALQRPLAVSRMEPDATDLQEPGQPQEPESSAPRQEAPAAEPPPAPEEEKKA